MYVHEQLNTATVVVLQVLFHYEIIYEMGPPMLEKYIKESQSRVASPQPLGRGQRRYNFVISEPRFRRFWKIIRLTCTYIVMCWLDVFVF